MVTCLSSALGAQTVSLMLKFAILRKQPTAITSPNASPNKYYKNRKRNRNSSTYSHAWISDVTSPLLSSQGRASSSMKHKYGKGHHSENDGTLGCSKEWQIARNITRGGSFHVPNPLDIA